MNSQSLCSTELFYNRLQTPLLTFAIWMKIEIPSTIHWQSMDDEPNQIIVDTKS